MYTGQRTTRLQKAIEREYERRWQDVVTHMLYVRRLTHSEAAVELRIPRSTLTTWVLQMDSPEPERELVSA